MLLILSSSSTILAQTYRWEKIQNFPSIYCNNLLQHNSKVYVAVGENYGMLGGVFRTTDTGNSWENMTPSGITSDNIRKVIVDSNNTLYAMSVSSASKSIFRSLNDGETWTKISNPSTYAPIDINIDRSNNLYGIFRIDSNNGYYTLRKSTDRGGTWIQLQTSYSPSYYWKFAIDFDDNIFVIDGSGVSGGIWVFNQKDSSWYPNTDGLPTLSIQTIAVNPTGQLLIGTSEDGVYAYSTILKQFIPTNEGINTVDIVSLFFSRTGRVFAGSQTRGVFYSDDGFHWTSMNFGLHHYYVTGFTELTNGEIFCSTWGGGLYRLQITNSVDNGFQKSFSLSVNPASTFTYITYTLDKPSFLTSSLVDVQGKVVKQHMKSWVDAGSHEMQLDVSNLPNGVYTVLLRTNDELMTTKLVVSR